MKIKDKIISGLYASMGIFGAINSRMAHDIYTNQDVARFMSNYQHDITAPFAVYFVMKLCGNSRITSAITTFGLYSAGEVAQGLGLYHGNFDPKDFLAYATGVGLAIIVDKLTFKNKKRVLDTKLV